MGLAPILPDCSVTWAASSCRKPNAGVVAACSEEGSCLVRAQAVLPNRLMNTPRKPFTGPDLRQESSEREDSRKLETFQMEPCG